MSNGKMRTAVLIVSMMMLGVPVYAGHFNATYILSSEDGLIVAITATVTRPAPKDKDALQMLTFPFIEEAVAAFGKHGFLESQVGPYTLFRNDRNQMTGFVDVALMEGRDLKLDEMKVCVQKNNSETVCEVLNPANRKAIIQWVVKLATGVDS